jgi:hypothetical protein
MYAALRSGLDLTDASELHRKSVAELGLSKVFTHRQRLNRLLGRQPL